MNRSGYSDDLYSWDLIRWRGAVKSAINGSRGQVLLRQMADALDAMPVKRLIAEDLRNKNGEVCALGAVGVATGVDVDALEPYDHDGLAKAFDVARALICEIEFINDDNGWRHDTPEERWCRVRKWVKENLASGAVA